MLFPDESELIERIALALIQRKERMGTAESCTGGLIAAACTSLAGSSQWFERGVVSYTNQAKTELLGVPAALITLHGAVSGEVAEQMARGLVAHAPIDWAIAVTGVAAVLFAVVGDFQARGRECGFELAAYGVNDGAHQNSPRCQFLNRNGQALDSDDERRISIPAQVRGHPRAPARRG